MVFSDHSLASELEHSNKILLSSACLPDLDLDCGTTYLKLYKKKEAWSESDDGVVSMVVVICALHEFIDIPGIVYLPNRLMMKLSGINEGDEIIVEQEKNVKKGEYLKIKPFEQKFIELNNPKIILEKFISERYPILSEGEVISFEYNDFTYHIEIVETKPSLTIQTTNCDINVDFEKPVDMADYAGAGMNAVRAKNKKERNQKLRNEKLRNFKRQNGNRRLNCNDDGNDSGAGSGYDMKRFPGVGRALGSK
jgi:hypothetical protein